MPSSSPSDGPLLTRLEQTPGRAGWGLKLELLRRWSERPEKAHAVLELLNAAVKEDSGHHEAWVALFEHLYRQGDTARAGRALEHAATTAPSSRERTLRWEQLARVLRGDPVSLAEFSDEATEVSQLSQVSFSGTPLSARRAESASESKETSQVAGERDRLCAAVEQNPLEPDAYDALSELYARAGDGARQCHMAELADALRGAGPCAPPLRRKLFPAELHGLRHPSLRHHGGELLFLAAPALLKMTSTASGTAAHVRFSLKAGPGAPAVGQAVRLAERTLGMAFEELRLSADKLPALRLRAAGGVRVEVGKEAVQRELESGQLRFEAGRALFSQKGDLLVLQHLSLKALKAAVAELAVQLDNKSTMDSLSPVVCSRLKTLFRHFPDLDLLALRQAARFSAQRAGLVVAGGIGYAAAALKKLGGTEDERRELVRFAASERCFLMRTGA